MIKHEKQLAGMTPAAKARMRKYGSTLDAYNVRKVIERIEDYPEIIEVVHLRDARMFRTRPEFDPELGGE